MKHLAFFIFFALIIYEETQGHSLCFGSCEEKHKGMENFNRDEFLGKHYLYKAHGTINPCITLTFTQDPKVQENIKVEQARELQITKALEYDFAVLYTGTIEPGKTNKASEMQVKWPYTNLFLSSFSRSFIILDSDYETYSVIYECVDFFGICYESVLVLTKNQAPSKETKDKISSVLTTNNIEESELSEVNQKDCVAQDSAPTVDVTPNNVLGLISDQKLETIKTKDELIKEAGLESLQTFNDG